MERDDVLIVQGVCLVSASSGGLAAVAVPFFLLLLV